MPGRRGDLQLRLARDEIDARRESPVRTVISNLRREINCYAQRDAQDIQKPEQRMPPQVPQHVPPEDSKILRLHSLGLTRNKSVAVNPATARKHPSDPREPSERKRPL